MSAQVSKLNFNGQNIYVGIDVHLKSWSVEVLSQSSVLKKFSQSPDPNVLYQFLTTNYPGATYYSVYEAGFCGFWIHHRLHELGVNSIVVNAADVPTMSKEKLRKTDAVDCSKLARGLRNGDLIGIYIPSIVILEMRSLIRQRNSVVKDTTREKNRIKSFLYFHGIHIPTEFTQYRCWSKRFIKWIEGIELNSSEGRTALNLHLDRLAQLRLMLLQVMKEIRKLIAREPFAEQMSLITSVPGIGIVTGISFILEIDDIRRFKNSWHLASFIGLVPMCHSSGEKEGVGGMTVRKHAMLRCYIIEAAWIAIRKDPAMTLKYEEYKKRMPANKAIVRIARKLINRIYFVLKKKQKYENSVVK